MVSMIALSATAGKYPCEKTVPVPSSPPFVAPLYRFYLSLPVACPWVCSSLQPPTPPPAPPPPHPPLLSLSLCVSRPGPQRGSTSELAGLWKAPSSLCSRNAATSWETGVLLLPLTLRWQSGGVVLCRAVLCCAVLCCVVWYRVADNPHCLCVYRTAVCPTEQLRLWCTLCLVAGTGGLGAEPPSSCLTRFKAKSVFEFSSSQSQVVSVCVLWSCVQRKSLVFLGVRVSCPGLGPCCHISSRVS